MYSKIMDTGQNTGRHVSVYHLPPEILSYIFEHLCYSDRNIVRLVCKPWYIASQDPILLDKEKLSIISISNERLQDFLHNVRRKFLHLSVRCFFDEDHCCLLIKKFGEQCGASLKTLSLNQCNVDKNQLLETLPHFPALQSLEITDCPALFRSTPFVTDHPKQFELERLKEVHFNGLNANLLKKIFSFAPNLKEVSVMLVLPDDYPKWRHLLELKEKHPHCTFNLSLKLHQNYHSIQQFIVLIKESHMVLSRLDIHRDHATDSLPESVLEAIEITAGYRNSLHLGYFEEITLGSDLDNLQFARLCRVIPDVKHLRLPWSDLDPGLEYLNLLTSLTSLVLHGNSTTDGYILPGLCVSRVNTTLKSLTFERHYLTTPRCVLELARCLPALTHLNLSYTNSVTDRSVQAIFCHQVMLECLILRGCLRLTDAGLSGVKDNSNEEYGSQTGYAISRLKRLRSLDLSSNEQIIGTSFGELKGLDIRQLNLKNTSIGRGAVVSLFENNRSIEKLTLPRSYSMTEDIWVLITSKLLRLKELTL